MEKMKNKKREIKEKRGNQSRFKELLIQLLIIINQLLIVLLINY